MRKSKKTNVEQALSSYGNYGSRPPRTEIFREGAEPDEWKPAEETSDTILKQMKLTKAQQKASNELITKHMT